MVQWINRNKRWLQVAVVAFGALLLALVSYHGYNRMGGWNFQGRDGKNFIKGLSKPAELGIFVLVALFAVRKLFKMPFMQKIGRELLRFLQVVHVPLGFVVFASAAVHGWLFYRYQWQGDFSHWSGVAAMALMAIAVVLGLFTMARPGRKQVHLLLGLATFVIALVHIAAPSGDGGPGGFPGGPHHFPPGGFPGH